MSPHKCLSDTYAFRSARFVKGGARSGRRSNRKHCDATPRLSAAQASSDGTPISSPPPSFSGPPEQRLATSQEALFNCVNILLGCGVLSIPYALAEGGWAAFGVLAVLGLATNYTGKLLINCQEYYNLHPEEIPPASLQLQQDGLMSSYEDIAEAAFGKLGKQFMQTVLYTELLGTCALFLILEKDHANLLLPLMGFNESAFSDTTLLAIAFMVVLPTTWLPDLSALSYVGAAGFASAIVLSGIVAYVFVTTGAHPDTTALMHLHNLPMTFGLLAFVFAGHAVFPAIYKGMAPEARPEFGRVLDSTYIIVAAVCMLVGFCGYSVYGAAVQEEITLNLPDGILSIAATLLVLVSPFAKFALTLEPVAEGADAALASLRNKPLGALQRPLVRTGLAASTLVLASRVPFFGIFMSILGSFLTLTVSIIFPCMAHWRMNNDRMSLPEKARASAVITVGTAAMVAGTATALSAILPKDTSTWIATSSTALLDTSNWIATSSTALLQHEPSVFKTLVCNSLCTAM